MITIERAAFLVSGILATTVLVGGGYAVNREYERIQTARQAGAAVEAMALLNKATIEMSLERSVTQVGLALPGPLPDNFRELLETQRQKSDEFFARLEERLRTAELPNGQRMLTEIERKRSIILEIRRAVESDLRAPAGQRTTGGPAEVARLKDAIIALVDLGAIVRPESGAVPAEMLTQDLAMQRAWIIREYGGRERTHFAIALALGQPIPDAVKMEMAESHGRVLQSWALLSKTNRTVIDAKVRRAIDLLETSYFGEYERLRTNLFLASDSGRYPVDFARFFADSSKALDTAVAVVIAAGEANVDAAQNLKTEAGRSVAVLAVACIVALALTALLVHFFLVTIVGRIRTITTAMRELAAGRTTVDLDSLAGSDEVGHMARALIVFRDAAGERDRLEKEAAERARREGERQSMLEKSTKEFIGQVSASLERLGLRIEGMRQASEALSSAASAANQSAETARGASGTASSGAAAAAAAAAELSSSIREITEQANGCQTFAREVAVSAAAGDTEIAELTSAVKEIGTILGLIQSIARKTNLLALNATIEAARAGEAGRGFAVVANEVKSLAEQTAGATGDIERQIASIQQRSETAVAAIREITAKITEMNDLTGGIAAAVVQQEASTAEIARTIQHAAQGSQGASAAVDAVTGAAEQTNTEARKLAASSSDLATVASEIEKAVRGFVGLVQGDINERRHSNRAPVDCEVTIEADNRSFSTRARDCSDTGMRIAHSVPLSAGDVVKISSRVMNGPARIAWSNSSGTGLQLIKGTMRSAS